MDELIGSSGYCRPCNRTRSKRHREANKQSLAAKDRVRSVLQEGITFSSDDKVIFWKRQYGMCFCCLTPIAQAEIAQAQVDHLTPIAKGGTNSTENLALAHRACNLEKHNKTLQEHWKWRFSQGKDTLEITKHRFDDAMEAAKWRR
ncbi:HNH endonuclease [Roseomonas sp. WA12]